MTYETKTITFHVIHVKVSNDSPCLRTLPMNVAIESAHCDKSRCSSQCSRVGLNRQLYGLT